jgi:hypothetical protein
LAVIFAVKIIYRNYQRKMNNNNNRTFTPTDLSDGNEKRYAPDTLLADIIDKETAEDTPKRDEVIQKRKKLLEENELFRLKDWAALSADDKDRLDPKVPLILRKLLDKACQSGKLFLKHNSFITNTIYD